MPYDLNWQDEDRTIIRVDMFDKVTWEQFYEVMDQVAHELAHSSQRIDLILNDSVGMPKGNPIPHLKASSAKLMSYASLGLIITVTNHKMSPLTRTFIDILKRMQGFDMSREGGFCDSVEEAVARIDNHRASQGWINTA